MVRISGTEQREPPPLCMHRKEGEETRLAFAVHKRWPQAGAGEEGRDAMKKKWGRRRENGILGAIPVY